MTTENAINVPPYRGTDLVYGLWRDYRLVVVGAKEARAIAEEIDAIVYARTWAEAYAASQEATHIYGPFEEEFFDHHDPSDPVIETEIPGWEDGDWPPMLCLYTGDFLPEDWPIGELYVTVLNGEGIVIQPDDEQRLLAIAQAAGAKLTRDDALIGRLDPQWP